MSKLDKLRRLIAIEPDPKVRKHLKRELLRIVDASIIALD